MEKRKRPVKLNVRFTEEEFAALKEKAEEAGLSMNDFIRKLVAGKEFNTCPPQEANKLLWELYAVGSDVRRFLAKVDEVRLADASQMRKVLAHVYLAVDKIVKFYHIEGRNEMAVTSIWPIKGRVDKVIAYVRNPEKVTEEYLSRKAALHVIDGVVQYAADDTKTERMEYVTGVNCAVETATEEFLLAKRMWHKEDGRLCYHGY